MPLKGAKKKKYNKKYYADNKQKISERKKEAYRKNTETNRLETAAHKKDDYNMNLRRNHLKNATHMKRKYNNEKLRKDCTIMEQQHGIFSYILLNVYFIK